MHVGPPVVKYTTGPYLPLLVGASPGRWLARDAPRPSRAVLGSPPVLRQTYTLELQGPPVTWQTKASPEIQRASLLPQIETDVPPLPIYLYLPTFPTRASRAGGSTAPKLCRAFKGPPPLGRVEHTEAAQSTSMSMTPPCRATVSQTTSRLIGGACFKHVDFDDCRPTKQSPFCPSICLSLSLSLPLCRNKQPPLLPVLLTPSYSRHVPAHQTLPKIRPYIERQAPPRPAEPFVRPGPIFGAGARAPGTEDRCRQTGPTWKLSCSSSPPSSSSSGGTPCEMQRAKRCGLHAAARRHHLGK
ncbi:hypothetical protein EV126DRAFT_407563 [Verticillium dahliae]|nr:hypothetical protein EV126DRAFT_407563 [Verticillium dahliae]